MKTRKNKKQKGQWISERLVHCPALLGVLFQYSIVIGNPFSSSVQEDEETGNKATLGKTELPLCCPIGISGGSHVGDDSGQRT